MRKLMMAGLIAASLIPSVASAQYYGYGDGYRAEEYHHAQWERREAWERHQAYLAAKHAQWERERAWRWHHFHDRDAYYRGW